MKVNLSTTKIKVEESRIEKRVNPKWKPHSFSRFCGFDFIARVCRHKNSYGGTFQKLEIATQVCQLSAPETDWSFEPFSFSLRLQRIARGFSSIPFEWVSLAIIPLMGSKMRRRFWTGRQDWYSWDILKFWSAERSHDVQSPEKAKVWVGGWLEKDGKKSAQFKK